MEIESDNTLKRENTSVDIQALAAEEFGKCLAKAIDEGIIKDLFKMRVEVKILNESKARAFGYIAARCGKITSFIKHPVSLKIIRVSANTETLNAAKNHFVFKDLHLAKIFEESYNIGTQTTSYISRQFNT